MVQRRSENKGEGLACWFQQAMEFVDASDEEAPPVTPKEKTFQEKIHPTRCGEKSH